MKKIIIGISMLIFLVGCQNNYSVSGSDIANYVKPKKKEVISPWKPTDWQTVKSLVEGKTLVAKDKVYCSNKDKSLNKECVKIAILESTKTRKSRRKLTSTIIYPSKKKIIKEEWGLGEYNIATTGLDIGIENIPVDSRRYPFRKLVYLHKDGKHLQIRNPKTKKILDIAIIENNNAKFLRDAKRKNYKSINYRGQRTLSQVIGGSIATSVVAAMKDGSNYSQKAQSATPSTKNATSKTSTPSTSRRNKNGVKEVYVGSHANGRAQYVIKCHNGNSYYSINLHSNGFWYSYGSNMGDNYKNLSINAVANKKCR